MTSNIDTFLQFLFANWRDQIIVRMEYKPNKDSDSPCPGHNIVMQIDIDRDNSHSPMGERMVFAVKEYKFIDLIESGCTCYEEKGWFIHHASRQSTTPVFVVAWDRKVPRFWNNRTGRGFSIVDQRWTELHRSYVEVQL